MKRQGTRRAAALAAILVFAIAVPAAAEAAPAYEGTNVHTLANENYQDLDRELDAVAASGSNVVRVDINWSALEPTGPSQYSAWYRQRIDRFMQGAKARNLKVLATLLWTPCWASSAPSSVKLNCSGDWASRGVTKYAPTRASSYGNIARYVATRWRTSLVGIEVWNEPNRPGFLKANDQATAYVPLVKSAYSSVKAVAPEVKVVAGAIAGANDVFLTRLFVAGMKGYYDAVSVHPYVADLSLGPDTDWGPTYAAWTFLPGLKLIHTTQALVGDKKPVWATEFGWHTGSARDAYPYTGVAEQTQADYLARAFQLLQDPSSGLDFVEGALTYDLRDDCNDLADLQCNFGLLRRDFSEKPSFSAVRSVIGG